MGTSANTEPDQSHKKRSPCLKSSGFTIPGQILIVTDTEITLKERLLIFGMNRIKEKKCLYSVTKII